MKCFDNMKTVYLDENNVVLDGNGVERKPCINRESKSFELTIYLYSCHDINMKFLVVVTPPSIYHTPRGMDPLTLAARWVMDSVNNLLFNIRIFCSDVTKSSRGQGTR